MIFSDFKKFSNSKSNLKKALEYSFQLANKNEKNPNDFILMLAEAHGKQDNKDFLAKLHISTDSFFSYLSETIQFYKSSTFQRLFVQDIDESDSANLSIEFTLAQRRQSIIFDLMIYCQIWESKDFLKSLFRLACLINGENYPWVIKINDSNKGDFIKNKILKKLKHNDNELHDLIDMTFNGQLRNAFAHSQIGFVDNGVVLLNYNHPNKKQGMLYDKIEMMVIHSLNLFQGLNYFINLKIKEKFDKYDSSQIQISVPDGSSLITFNEYFLITDKEMGLFKFA